MGVNTAGIEARAVRAIPIVSDRYLVEDVVKNRYETFDEYLRDADRAHFTGDPEDFGAEGAIQYITHLEIAGEEEEDDIAKSYGKRVLFVVVVYVAVMWWLQKKKYADGG